MSSTCLEKVKKLIFVKTVSSCCTINPSNRQLWLKTNQATLHSKRADAGFYRLCFPKGKRKEIKLSSNTSSCWRWDSCCQAGEAIWAISEMAISIQQPFEAWYTNCENKRAHTQCQAGEEAHHCTRATHTHTHTGLTTTHCCLRRHQWSQWKTRQLLLSACAYTASKPEQVCVCVFVCKSIRIWLNQQACPLLSAVFQRDPCIQSVFISKQSIKETGSGSVSWDQIDVVQIPEDSGPLWSVGHSYLLNKSSRTNALKGQFNNIISHYFLK